MLIRKNCYVNNILILRTVPIVLFLNQGKIFALIPILILVVEYLYPKDLMMRKGIHIALN